MVEKPFSDSRWKGSFEERNGFEGKKKMTDAERKKLTSF